MIGYVPEPGAPNVDAIAWDIVQVLISSGLPMISYEPLPGSSNFEALLWDILQNIGGGGGGGGLPAGNNGDILNYSAGNWRANDVILDGIGAPTFDNNRRILFDSTGADSANWDNRFFFDSTGASSLDYGNRLALDSGGTDSINWDTRRGFDASGAPTLDWERHFLIIDTSGLTRMDWKQGFLYGNSADVAMFIPGRQIFDSSGAQSFNGSTRILYDQANDAVFNWSDVTAASQAFFYSAWKIGFGNYGTDANLTHSVTIGTPGLRLQGLSGAAAGGADIGSITVNINGTDRKINFKA